MTICSIRIVYLQKMSILMQRMSSPQSNTLNPWFQPLSLHEDGASSSKRICSLYVCRLLIWWCSCPVLQVVFRTGMQPHTSVQPNPVRDQDPRTLASLAPATWSSSTISFHRQKQHNESLNRSYSFEFQVSFDDSMEAIELEVRMPRNCREDEGYADMYGESKSGRTSPTKYLYDLHKRFHYRHGAIAGQNSSCNSCQDFG